MPTNTDRVQKMAGLLFLGTSKLLKADDRDCVRVSMRDLKSVGEIGERIASGCDRGTRDTGTYLDT